MNSRFLQLLRFGMLLALAALLAGCGGLSSEPRTVSTLIPPTDEPATATAVAATATAENTSASTAAAQIAQGATQQASTEAPEVRGVVNGRVENHTRDGKIPPDMKLTLHLINQVDTGAPETTFDVTANAQGDFEFKDVPLHAYLVYTVTTTYLGRQISSDPVSADPANKTLTIPVRIYETTGDPQVISIASLITQINADPGGLQVAQVIHLKNSSDRMFTGDKELNTGHPGDKIFPSVSFVIPHGASLMGFGDTTGRFVTSTDGSTITDTTPVLPDEDHVVHFIYTMPYNPAGTAIEQPFPYAVNGQATVYVRPTAVSVSSEQLVSFGLQNRNDVDYLSYGGTLTLDAGKSLRFDVRGQLQGADTQPTTPGPISRDLLVGLLIGGGFGLIVVGGAFMVYERFFASRTARAHPAPDSASDALVWKLAQLDEAYEGGKIDKTAYTRQRQELKRRLARQMKHQG